MFQKSMKVVAIAAVAAALVAMTGVASAQSSPAQTTTKLPVLVDYYSSLTDETVWVDGTLRITNFGSTGGEPAPNGNLCAMIYVFDTQEELQECCGCVLTPDGLRTLSVFYDLTHNPNNNEVLNTGEIKILTAPPNSGGSCDPSFGGPAGTVTLGGALAAWGTHVQFSNPPVVGTGSIMDSGVQVTETAAQLESASAADVNRVAKFLCGSIVQNSSGRGICTCGSGE